jgi:TolB-like protein/tetratricopeptide (TPR) repeat protein
VINVMGDGFLVEFPSALSAVNSALDIQKRIARRNHSLAAERRFQVRIGIHLGDVVWSNGDVYGDGVNLASRIEPIAEPGGVCFSQQVYDQVRNSIHAPVSRLPQVELKNVANRIDLYRISFNTGPPVAPPMKIEEKSVAVLPFVSMTAGCENQLLSDGLTEEIITALSQVKGLRVPASTSSFSFKATRDDIRKIGAKLSVSKIVEGSVRRHAHKLRVTAKLIKVSDGYNLWSQRYEREIEDLFAIQDEISRAIVHALKIRLTPENDAGLARRHTRSTEAYELYVKGRHCWNQRGIGLQRSLHYFELAILEDPVYALAHAGLADALLLLGYYGFLPGRDAFPKAKAAALKSLELDAQLAEGHCALAFASFLFDWDWATVQKEFNSAIELNPGYITAHYLYASCLLAMGENEAALAADYRALEKDPFAVLANAHLAWTLVGLRQYDAALKQIARTLELDANFAIAHRLLGQCQTQLGRHAEAVRAFENAVALSNENPAMLAWLAYALGKAGQPSRTAKIIAQLEQICAMKYVRSFHFALACAGIGDKERALYWLAKACDERDFWWQWIGIDAAFDGLRNEKLFGILLENVRARQPPAPIPSLPLTASLAVPPPPS